MIYVDVSAAVHSRAGLGRYSQSLAQALLDAQPDRFRLFFNRGRSGKLPDGLRGVPQRHINLGYKPWRLAVLLAQLGRVSFRRLVPEASLFHSTEHLLMPMGRVPTVLTVHDLIFELFPAYHKRLNYWYLNRAMPLFCRRATAIITVSEASKQDIVAHYAVSPDKIHVVHEAAAAHFQPPPAQELARVRAHYSLPEHYLVHLGTVEPRKNLSRLVEALQVVRREWPNLHLVLAGSKGWLFEDFFVRLRDEGLASVVRHLGWVPDADLPAVIAAADLAVQPSLYEGFGLPILEHMASGQVVAASNASSHPEIGGRAAAYFNPLDVGEIAGVILRLLKDSDEYRRRRITGLAWASKFSWQRAARETIAVYDRQL